MEKWTGFWLIGVLSVAILAGLLIQPTDSQTNLENTTWQGTYFANANLAGEPVLTRYERHLNYNWSSAAPLGVPKDNFSARWIGEFEFEAGRWNFIVGADDGVRLWVDGNLLIDQWEAGDEFNTYSTELDMGIGQHIISVEYYDQEGLAGINVRWELVPPPVVVNTPNPNGNDSSNDDTPPDTPIEATPATVGHVATGELAVYEGPGIQYARIGKIYLYQKFPIIGKNTDGSWYELDLRDGRRGWVSADFLFRSGQNTVPIVVEDANETPVMEMGISLNEITLRNLPGAQEEVIGMIVEDAEIEVLGRSSDSTWFLVRYGDLEGWALGLNIELNKLHADELPFIGDKN